MHLLRFVFPFLFARNWHNGAWEFSRARFVLFLLSLALIMMGIGIIYMLQSPVTYANPEL
jgi:hypothetical protein